MDYKERIEALIKMYQGSARNLRNVADLAPEDSPVAAKSRAKADTYDLVVDDLAHLLNSQEGT